MGYLKMKILELDRMRSYTEDFAMDDSQVFFADEARTKVECLL